jgi:hypothetical protein
MVFHQQNSNRFHNPPVCPQPLYPWWT